MEPYFYIYDGFKINIISKFIYEDENAYRKAIYHIALQNFATTQTNVHMLCRIISDIEPETDFNKILEIANRR